MNDDDLKTSDLKVGDLKMCEAAYRAFRRREAFCVPVTEEGIKQAEERFLEFSKGFDAGMKEAMIILERMHKEHKHNHNYFLIAKNEIERIRHN